MPAINGGAIYSPNGAGFFSGDIYGAESGSALGSFSATAIPAESSRASWATAISSPPVIVNNYVFVGSSSGLLYALDATTGTQPWSKNLGAPIPAPATPGVGQSLTGLAAGDGLLIVPAGNTVNAFVLSTSP
jgi:outer membrane protein assembly factor BamB